MLQYLAKPVLVGIFCISFAACAKMKTLPPKEPVEPESPHAATFKAISGYYCQYLKWPTVDELKIYADSQNLSVPWHSYGNPQINSDRAIIATLNYDSGFGMDSISFIAPPECGVPNKPPVVSMAGGRVSLVVPPDFEVLLPEDITVRWPNPPAPDVAWVSRSDDIVIAIRFGEVPLTPTDLPEFKNTLEEAYQNSVPGLEWKARGVRTANDISWTVLQFESDSSRGRMLNSSWSTSFDGKLLSLTLGGPVSQSEKLASLEDPVIESVVLK